MIHQTQVLKDEENKRKVLERTPMRRIGEVHEISGAPGCCMELHIGFISCAFQLKYGSRHDFEARGLMSVLRRCCRIPVLACCVICNG
jgi:hypothetical protein